MIRTLLILAALACASVAQAQSPTTFSTRPIIKGCTGPLKGADTSQATCGTLDPSDVPAALPMASAAQFGIVADDISAAAANCAAFDAAMVALGGATAGQRTLYLEPGKTYYTSCAIDMRFSGVGLKGARFERRYNAALTGQTRIAPGGGYTGPLVKMRSPYGASNPKLSGMSLEGVHLDAAGLSTFLLDVDSIAASKIKGVYLTNAVGGGPANSAAYFHSGVSGTDLADPADIQWMDIDIQVRQGDSAAAQAVGCVTLTGNLVANVSFNTEFKLLCTHFDGAALDVVNADSNRIMVTAYRGSGGTGATLICRGVTATQLGCRKNDFAKVSGPGANIFEGTDTAGVTAGTTNTAMFDTANSSPFPTIGAGTQLQWHDNRALTDIGNMMRAVAIGHPTSQYSAQVCSPLMTGESMRICNGSSRGLSFDNTTPSVAATGAFELSVDNSTKNFRLTRSVGTGWFYSAVPVQLPSMTVSALPTCTASANRGIVAVVTDSTTTTFNAAMTGGGANVMMALCTGAGGWVAR